MIKIQILLVWLSFVYKITKTELPLMMWMAKINKIGIRWKWAISILTKRWLMRSLDFILLHAVIIVLHFLEKANELALKGFYGNQSFRLYLQDLETWELPQEFRCWRESNRSYNAHSMSVGYKILTLPKLSHLY